MEDKIKELEAKPENWDLRCSIVQVEYENENYEEAARLILEAPEIPGDEENVIFTASVLGASDTESGHAILDQYLEDNDDSVAAHTLKAELFEMDDDETNAAIHKEKVAELSGETPGAEESVEEEPVAEEIEEAAEKPAASDKPVPVTPKKLRPPGAEVEEEEEEIPVATLPEAPVLYTTSVPTADAVIAEGEGHLGHEHLVDAGAWSFIVGDGEKVRASQKAPDTIDKLGAVIIAAVVHAVIFIALAFWALSTPRPSPPQISVSSLSNTNEETIETKTLTKTKQKTAAAVASSQQIVTSTSFSNFAMPDVVDVNNNLTMVSMADSDTGFGMSMSGFGDVSNMGAIPAGMRSRCSMSQRMQRLRESGGEDRAEKAVRKGLEFLSKQQNKGEKLKGAFGREYHAGMTGLTLLAYLGHCETPESPKFGESVVDAAVFLMGLASENDGKMTNGAKGHHEAYEHAIATYALCELYTMTKESGKEIPKLESILKKSVDLIVDAQTKMGGWPYGFEPKEGKEDMSVSGWQIQALKATYNTGRKFSGVEKALDKAVENYLPKIQDSKGAFKYNPDHAQGKPTLTGAALLGMQIWNAKDSKEYKLGLDYLNKAYANPSPGSNFYAPYYNTQVYFMHEGEEWENYNKKFQPRLLDAQNEDGSWLTPGIGGHGGADAQIMNTAWAILMLEVYYRYLPTTAKLEGLGER